MIKFRKKNRLSKSDTKSAIGLLSELVLIGALSDNNFSKITREISEGYVSGNISKQLTKLAKIEELI